MPRTCTNTDAFLNKANTFTGVNTFQATSGQAAILNINADNSEDDIDDWRIQVADGGYLTMANNASGAQVTHLTLTPHADRGWTAAQESSSVLAGGLLLSRSTYSTLMSMSTGSGTTVSLSPNTLNLIPYTGAAAKTVTLPAATATTVVIHYNRVDTTGGTNTLVFDCAGSDVYRTGSKIPKSFAASNVTWDNSTAGETKITFTPADATTNFISRGSQFKFWCVEDGIWDVELDNSQCMNNTLSAVTGTLAFSP